MLTEWGELNDKYYPDRDLESPVFHEDAMKIAEKFKSRNAWTGVGGQTRMMAFEEDTIELDGQGQPLRAEFDYDVVYFWASHYVHATVVALDEHACPRGELFRVRGGKLRQNLKDNALFNVLASIEKTFMGALGAMREDQPAALEVVHQPMKSYAKAQLALSRPAQGNGE